MLENENTIRISAFVGILLVMLAWESLAPRRTARKTRFKRRINNLSMIVLTTAFVRFFLPVLAALNMAEIARENGWGLMNWLTLNSQIELLLSILLLDLFIYGQHVMSHYVPIIWRFHRVHHSDKDLDVTSGIRFHPIEIIFSLLLKAFAVALIGASALAVLIFELLLNVMPMFNHSNAYIPEKLDRYLRRIIVTPDMHRIHHSIHKIETNSNYGFNVPWWDRIFGTYTEKPAEGQLQMEIGLDTIPESEAIHLHSLLLQPFKKLGIRKKEVKV